MKPRRPTYIDPALLIAVGPILLFSNSSLADVEISVAAPSQAATDVGGASTSSQAPGPRAAQVSTEPSSHPAREHEVAAGQASAVAADGNRAVTTVQPNPELAVSVVGERIRKAPGSAHVVSSKTLLRFGYDDPHAVMRLVPGVYVRQEDGVGLRPNIGIRGASADRSKKGTLLEDGVPFAPAPYSAPAAYYFPVFHRAYQMQIYKGPSAIKYGPQTIGGAIDLITRPFPSAPQGTIDLALGDFGYGHAHGYFGASDERSAYLIEGVHLRNDGFKQLPTGADTGFFRNEWMFKGAYTLDPRSARRNEVQVKLLYSDEISNETYLGLTDRDFRKNPLARYGASSLDRMRWYRTGLALTHRVEPMRDMRGTTTLYRSDFWRRWRKVNGFRGAQLFDVLRDPDSAGHAPLHGILTGQADSTSPEEAILIGPNERSFVSQGLQSKFELQTRVGGALHQIEYGIRLHNDRVERRHSEEAFLSIGGVLVPEGTPTAVTAFNEAFTTALSLYATDSATFGRLTLSPGLRLELSRSRYSNRASGARSGGASQLLLPGAGAYYAVTDHLGVLAGVHRGMSPPPPERDVKPEVSVNYEGGLRYSRGAMRAEVIGYFNDYSNLTSICTYSLGCREQDLDRQFSAGQAHIYGLEAFTESEFPIGALRLPIRAAYTLTFTEFLETFQSADPTLQSEDRPSGEIRPGDEMAYVPRHQAFASAGLETAKLGGYVSATYVDRMREFAGNKPMDQALVTDRQFTVDLGAHYRPFEFLKLYAHVRNVFDELYIVSRRPFGARPNAPRWVQVGARFEF